MHVMDSSASSRPETEHEGKPRIGKKLRLVIIAAVIIAGIAGAWWYYRYQTYGQYMQSTDNAYVAANSVVVSSKVAGYVDKVLVSENDRVAEHTPLVQLDLRDYRAQAAQARAQITATLAGGDTIRSQITEQDAAIRQARAQLAAARAALDLANEQVNRYRPLAASGAEPREKLDQHVMQAQQARAERRRTGCSGSGQRTPLYPVPTNQADTSASGCRARPARSRRSECFLDNAKS